MIVPRHPQRFDEVAALLRERGLAFVRRSEARPVPADVRLRARRQHGRDDARTTPRPTSRSSAAASLPLGAQNLIEACAVGTPVHDRPVHVQFRAGGGGGDRGRRGAPGTRRGRGVREARRLLGDAAARRRMGEAGAALLRRASRRDRAHDGDRRAARALISPASARRGSAPATGGSRVTARSAGNRRLDRIHADLRRLGRLRPASRRGCVCDRASVLCRPRRDRWPRSVASFFTAVFAAGAGAPTSRAGALASAALGGIATGTDAASAGTLAATGAWARAGPAPRQRRLRGVAGAAAATGSAAGVSMDFSTGAGFAATGHDGGGALGRRGNGAGTAATVLSGGRVSTLAAAREFAADSPGRAPSARCWLRLPRLSAGVDGARG